MGNGADINAKDFDSETSLDLAKKEMEDEVVEVLEQALRLADEDDVLDMEDSSNNVQPKSNCIDSSGSEDSVALVLQDARSGDLNDEEYTKAKNRRLG